MRAIPNPYKLLAFLLVFSFLPACAVTKFHSVSLDDTYTGGPLKKILIVGVANQSKYRLMFERIFTAEFGKRGVEAVASHKVIILASDLTKERIVRAAEKLGADAVLVTFVVGIKDQYLTYDSQNVQRATRGKLSWNWVNTYASEPITYTKLESVRLSTNIFERKTEKLVWNGISETVDMESVEEVIDSLCKAVLKDISKKGLIE